MSATIPASRADSIDSTTDSHPSTNPSDVFRKAIVENDAICSRCFARQRTLTLDVVPVKTVESNGDHLQMTPAEEPDTGDEYVLMESSDAVDSVEVVYPPRVPAPTAAQADVDVPASWKRACPEPTVFCAECAAIDDDGDRSTLSKAELVEHAKSVSCRLQEQDVAHDPALLVAVAKTLKGKPSVGSKDDHVLKHATRAGVEKRRYGRSRKMRLNEDANEIEVTPASDVAWMPDH
ncbi:hypothetical protein [Halorubellus sp. PRR65]|uniref:hypothetical protein n=1 Tax=Halorubellus sp. PRR65 TaxID=3098148 RepID=UPI002B257B91|nr:hypothetical protein [Halorubellus sp. PRR65]